MEHFWNDFAADRKRSVPEADRRLYARAYAQPGAMRAGFEYFRNFERDAEDFARMGSTRLSMPVLVLSGEKAGGTYPRHQRLRRLTAGLFERSADGARRPKLRGH